MPISAPRKLALLAAALFSASTGTAQLVVNIDFNAVVGTFSGQGAFSDPGHDFWNGVSSTAGGSNFTASDGTTATGVSMSVSNVFGLGFGGVPTLASDLLADYLFVGSNTTATFTISGLTAGQAYDFYLYSVAGGSGTTNRAAIFTLEGVSQNVSALNVASFTEGTNFVLFHLTPGGTSVNGSFVVAPGHAEAELNGLQIVAVPESSTLAYGSLGSAMILTRAVFLRRRRQRSALGSARSTAAA